MAKTDIEVSISICDICYDDVIAFFDEYTLEYARHAEHMHSQAAKDTWADMAANTSDLKFKFQQRFKRG